MSDSMCSGCAWRPQCPQDELRMEQCAAQLRLKRHLEDAKARLAEDPGPYYTDDRYRPPAPPVRLTMEDRRWLKQMRIVW